MPVLTLYSRAECGLCHEVRQELAALAAELAWSWREIVIDADPALQERFGRMVPVIDVEGGPVLFGAIRGEDLLAALAEAQHA